MFFKIVLDSFVFVLHRIKKGFITDIQCDISKSQAFSIIVVVFHSEYIKTNVFVCLFVCVEA